MKKQKRNKKPADKKKPECPIMNIKGKKVDVLALSTKVFDGTVNTTLLHQVITMYQANQRAGSACTKTKGQVSGGGKKPWRQKGTGRARTGSIRNPLWRGGGIIFGPKPRDFSWSVPKEMRRVALKSSLNEKFLEDRIIVVDSIKLEEPKTKRFYSALMSLGIKKGENVMVIVDGLDNNTKLASR
ncbi:MAG: 50S ribosomal protein L4, partial [Candidatus Omnitrophota bacterium]